VKGKALRAKRKEFALIKMVKLFTRGCETAFIKSWSQRLENLEQIKNV
jgi:hypothetical protein